MTDVLRIKLPTDVVNIVKLYTGETKIRNGVSISQIKKNDRRYSMLLRRPRIRQLNCATRFTSYDRRGSAWFKNPDNNRHVIISVYYDVFYKRLLWEMATLGGNIVRINV